MAVIRATEKDVETLARLVGRCGFLNHQVIALPHGITNRTQVDSKHIVFSHQPQLIAHEFKFERMINWYNIIGIPVINNQCNHLCNSL